MEKIGEILTFLFKKYYKITLNNLFLLPANFPLIGIN
jgi:hypothetical protein